jgi:5-formyltetrahydrofolate cyclo-ligase
VEGTPIGDRKRALRREMRALRRALPDLDERSARLWATVEQLPAVGDAKVVMVFDSVQGEPVTAPFVEWCREHGKTVHLPEDDPPPDPLTIDVVIVPGTAFTPSGDRLGQGGGWYDRFLETVRPDCVTIGVAFAAQIVSELPVEPHDVRVDHVVTESP